MAQLLPFLLGEERYGLMLTEIQEVIEEGELHYLPAAPETIIAAVNVHGRILPVLDLQQLFGFSADRQSDRMIVLARRDFPLVLAVRRLEAVLSVDPAQTAPVPGGAAKNCIGGVLHWNGQMINLLDLDQLRLRIEDLCTATGGGHATARTDS